VPGDHQVLVHMRAVALNRGDWEILETVPAADMEGPHRRQRWCRRDRGGRPAVRDFHPGDKVTSLYFRNWTGGRPDAGKLSEVTGQDVNGGGSATTSP